MNLADRITRWMSLREPQADALGVLDRISAGLEYRNASLATVAEAASAQSRPAHPVEFDTVFPSFCFALATGVGKTRLMGASIAYLWRAKSYRHFFILAPNITVYDKLRAELDPAHPKYMFVGLSDFPRPDVFDGDSYLRFQAGQPAFDNRATIFVFNIGKIFAPRVDAEFRFHKNQELLGNSFAAILREMDDLVMVMDESHRYRAPASLKAINHLKPVLGLEFSATPKKDQRNVVYSFGLAEAIGRFVKTPAVITRTNLTLSDAEEIEQLKLRDGLLRHEMKKGRLREYCEANRLPLVKPFVLISTKDTAHASQVRASVEQEGFMEGRYRGKVIEIHSGQSGAESDENVRRLLAVEHATSGVEVVIHVNMLKEGWDVNNLYTIIPLRASTSEILTEQTIGRGLRLPFGRPTGDHELDALEIISHDQYAKLIAAAKDSPLFHIRQLEDADFRPMETVPVTHRFADLDRVLDRLAERQGFLLTAHLSDEEKLAGVVGELAAEELARFQAMSDRVPVLAEDGAAAVGEERKVQEALFPVAAAPQAAPVPFDPEVFSRELTEKLRDYASAAIDVPDIITETSTERRFEPFPVRVTAGPFALVEQRIRKADLSTGQEEVGERLEILDVENPRAFLAAKLIGAVEELDVPNDKETVLALVDGYLAQIDLPSEALKKIVHLYRDTIVRDLKTQVETHIHDETHAECRVRRGFVKFRGYSKTILKDKGRVPYTNQVPKSDVQRYLFTGYTKGFYPEVPFDSAPEKDFATILERDLTVLRWVRPPEGNIPIYWRGRNYNPDFIVETADRKYLVEVKRRREIGPPMDAEVKEKAIAALRWCQTASGIPGGKPWEYKLIPDDAIDAANDFRFTVSQAHRFDGVTASV